MTTILDGRLIARGLQLRLRERLTRLDFTPNLVALLVGDDPASMIYVRRKKATAHSVGINAGNVGRLGRGTAYHTPCTPAIKR